MHKHQLGTRSGADCTISIMSTNGKPSIDMINSEKKQQNGDEKTVCRQRGGELGVDDVQYVSCDRPDSRIER